MRAMKKTLRAARSAMAIRPFCCKAGSQYRALIPPPAASCKADFTGTFHRLANGTHAS
jgi:hypothetical protein